MTQRRKLGRIVVSGQALETQILEHRLLQNTHKEIDGVTARKFEALTSERKDELAPDTEIPKDLYIYVCLPEEERYSCTRLVYFKDTVFRGHGTHTREAREAREGVHYNLDLTSRVIYPCLPEDVVREAFKDLVTFDDKAFIVFPRKTLRSYFNLPNNMQIMLNMWHHVFTEKYYIMMIQDLFHDYYANNGVTTLKFGEKDVQKYKNMLLDIPEEQRNIICETFGFMQTMAKRFVDLSYERLSS